METLTFGPVCVNPRFPGAGYWIITQTRHSLHLASRLTFNAIIIQGYPHHYCKHGFKSSKDYNISDQEGNYPYSLPVRKLQAGCHYGKSWNYLNSELYTSINPDAVAEFDKQFGYEKKSISIPRKSSQLPVGHILMIRHGFTLVISKAAVTTVGPAQIPLIIFPD